MPSTTRRVRCPSAPTLRAAGPGDRWVAADAGAPIRITLPSGLGRQRSCGRALVKKSPLGGAHGRHQNPVV